MSSVAPCVECGRPGRSSHANTTCSDLCWKAYKKKYDHDFRLTKPKADRKDYFDSRREIKRQYDIEYREKNSERVLAARREWTRNRTASRPEYGRLAAAKRRARKLSNGAFLVTEKDLARCLARHGQRCVYCRKRFTEESPLHWDHVVPVTRGGSHGVGNLLPSCARCNQSKHNKLLSEWRYRSRDRTQSSRTESGTNSFQASQPT